MSREPVTLSKVQGDRMQRKISLLVKGKNTAPTLPFDGVARFIIRDGSDNAVLALQSYNLAEISVVDAANWEFLVTMRSGVDSHISPGIYRWEFETTQKLSQLYTSPAAGTVSVTAGSGVVTLSSALVAADVRRGLILEVQGQKCAIVDTPALNSDLTANQIQTDFTAFTTDAAASFALYETDVKSRLFGEIELEEDLNR